MSSVTDITYELRVELADLPLSVSIGSVSTAIESYQVVPPTGLDASLVLIDPVGYITSNTLQNALAEIGKKTYSTSVVPTFIEKGTTWYDTANNQYYVYREIGPGVLQWVPIMVGNDSEDSDTVDAGAF